VTAFPTRQGFVIDPSTIKGIQVGLRPNSGA
jgi:hypothetical protein